MILLQCPPAASPLPPVVGTGGYTLVEPWDYGISQVGRGARGSPNPNTGSSRNYASAQSDDQTLPELQQLWGCARCLGGWEGCSVPTALRSLIGVSEGRSGGAAPCAGLRARCCRAGRGRGGRRAGRKEVRAACPEANKHRAPLCAVSPSASGRSGMERGGAERGRGGGAGADRQRRRRGGRAGGGGGSGPGAGGVGRGGGPEPPTPCPQPGYGAARPRSPGSPHPDRGTVRSPALLVPSAPQSRGVSLVPAPRLSPVCAHPPPPSCSPRRTPRPLHPRLGPVPSQGPNFAPSCFGGARGGGGGGELTVSSSAALQSGNGTRQAREEHGGLGEPFGDTFPGVPEDRHGAPQARLR